MDSFANPALLGGITACVALIAWTLGRWQSGAVPMAEARRPAPVVEHPPFEWRAETADRAAPCRQAARDERTVALESAQSLGELHAEVSAYRHEQQVFAAVADDGLQIDLLPADALATCRYIGLTGQPTCPAPDPALAPCGCGVLRAAQSQTAPQAGPCTQPAPVASALTRV